MNNFLRKIKFLGKDTEISIAKTKKYKIGIIYGVFVGIIFGIIPIVTILNNTQIYESLRLSQQFVSVNAMNSIARGASISAFNDMWTFLLNGLLLLVLPGMAKNWKKVKDLIKTKAGFYTLLAGLFGGPLGNTFFFAVFVLLSPSIGSVFFVLEMVFSAGVGIIIFKRKIGKRVWYGLGLMTLLIVFMLVAQTIAVGGTNSNVIAGSILGTIAIACYTAEALIVDRAVSINKIKGINGLHFLQLKAISSTVFGILILIPLTSGIFGIMFQGVFPDVQNSANIVDINVVNNVNNLGGISNINAITGYLAFAKLFTVMSFPIAFVGSLLLFAGRISFYNAIEKTGATLTNTLFQIQVIVTPIIGGILFGISQALGVESIGGGDAIYVKISLENQLWFQPLFWTLSILVLISAWFVSLNKIPINRLKENTEFIKKTLVPKN
ncbi:EamA family transporter [[Mycoplasma] mobile]|uniref:Expressed protein n=1 Tax=Mycoplasma mobile (strain ATCC 43663 / 163K / NCTC 11711) TaxID=267748 RepID=Q6KHI5_MYCM1|nr:EamA family transporter [[Mycoplasma] mobile]AAT27945.1 expressed protein [Mycoplasma mobile 163K]